MDTVTKNNPENPVADPISQSAADVAAAVARNNALSGGGDPPASVQDKPSWHREPLANFETDEAGRVVLRPDGSPIRKGGRPRKPRPGDKLAGGDVQPGQPGQPAQPQSRVVIPGVADNPPDQGEAVAGEVIEPPADDAGEELGRVVSQGVTRIADAVASDEKKKMTTDEKDALEKHMSRMIGRAHAPAWLAVGIVILCWAVRVLIQSRLERKPKEATPADVDAPTDNRSNPVGKIEHRQATVAGYTW